MNLLKRKIFIFFIFVIFIFIESISFATYINANETKIKSEEEINQIIGTTEVCLTSEEQEVLNLINEYRMENGLSELKPANKLQEVADLKAKDLVENKYFSHVSENLGTPFEMLKSNNIDYAVAGENLAGNINSSKAVEAWINSPTHKANILDEEFKYTGISVVESPVYGKVFVQIFVDI